MIRWKNRPRHAEIDAAILADYRQHGPAGIAARFGMPEKVIARRAFSLGTKSDTRARRSALTRSAASTTVNTTFFDEWSPNMAWMLGYIWTDGTVVRQKTDNRIGFRCAVRDKHIIYDIRETLCPTATIEHFPSAIVQGRYIGQPQIGVRINSIHLVNKVVDGFGIPPNKSNIDPPMPTIPGDYLCHFVRGVIDGDGSIFLKPGKNQRHYGHISCLGTHRFIESLRHQISAVTGVGLRPKYRRLSSPKICCVAWYSRHDVVRLVRWLYPDGNYLFLHRKREAADRIIAYYGGPAIATDTNGRSKEKTSGDRTAASADHAPDALL